MAQSISYTISKSDTWGQYWYSSGGTISTNGELNTYKSVVCKITFPSFKKRIEAAISDSTKTFIISKVSFFTCRQDSSPSTPLQIRVNNDNTSNGIKIGSSVTSNSGTGTGSYTEHDITDLKDIFSTSDNNLILHFYALNASSSNDVTFRDPVKYPGEKGLYPKITVTYEVISNSGSDSGEGDGEGDDEETTNNVTLANSVISLNNTSITYGSSLVASVSSVPSPSSISYSWIVNGRELTYSSETINTSNLNVSQYFDSNSKEVKGSVTATITYTGTDSVIGTNPVKRTVNFTITLPSSGYEPTNFTYSCNSSHSSGSYIPGSKVIWSASATARAGASIAYYQIKIGTSSAIAYTSTTSTSDILPKAQGTYDAYITAVDTRGYSVSRSFTITVSSNIAPIINAKVIRCDANGDENMISGEYYKLTGTVSADQTSGTKYITSLKIIASQDGTTNPTISKIPNVTSYNLSNIGVQALPTGAETSFEIKIITSDGTMSREITLFGPSAAYIIHIATGGKSLGLGSAASSTEKTIACGWDLYTNGALETNGIVTHSYEPLQIGQGGTGVRTLRGLQDLLGLPTNNDTIITSSNIDNFVTIDLTGYATQTWVQNQGYTTLNTVQTWVNGKGYLTSLPSNVITTSNIGAYIPNIQTGITSRVAISADSTYTGTVTFPSSFSRVPQVFVTLVNGDLQNDFSNAYGQVYCCIATNANSSYTPSITTTGFTYLIANDSSSGKGARVQWVAIG